MPNLSSSDQIHDRLRATTSLLDLFLSVRQDRSLSDEDKVALEQVYKPGQIVSVRNRDPLSEDEEDEEEGVLTGQQRQYETEDLYCERFALIAYGDGADPDHLSCV